MPGRELAVDGIAHPVRRKLVALGVTSAKRDPVLPETPSIAEAGLPSYELIEYQGIVAPAGTPRATISRLHDDIVKSLCAPDVKERFSTSGTYIVGSTPEELSDHIKKQITAWVQVIKAAGIRLD